MDINLSEENEQLRQKLEEAEELIDAIRTGAIDALAVHGEDGPKIFTLRSADHTYRMLVEKMNEGALTLNKEGIILYCNSRFAAMVNQALFQVIGSSFINYILPAHQKKFQQMLSKGWEENCRGDFVINTIQNNPLHIYISLNTIESLEGLVLSMVVTDLTEITNAYNQLKKAQDELKQLNLNLEKIVAERTEDAIYAKQQLQKSNKELINKNEQLIKTNIDLDNFIYTASHDLKAPISNIEGLLDILKKSIDNQSNEETEMILQMINRSVNRFKITIQDLTNITKVQKGTNDDQELLDCLQIIEDVKFSISDMIRNSGAKIKIDVEECRYLKFSKKNFKSIIYNLISNGIKYSDPNRPPEITIQAKKKIDFIKIKITDNGLGIPDHHKEKIFFMFKRFHDHVDGTGIGLYIVKRIIENAGGKIEVDSEVNKGTTFIIFLPINQPEISKVSN